MKREMMTGEWCKVCMHQETCRLREEFKEFQRKIFEKAYRIENEKPCYTNFMARGFCLQFERVEEPKSIIKELEEINETIAEQKQITERGGMAIVKALQYIVKRLEETNSIEQEGEVK